MIDRVLSLPLSLCSATTQAGVRCSCFQRASAWSVSAGCLCSPPNCPATGCPATGLHTCSGLAGCAPALAPLCSSFPPMPFPSFASEQRHPQHPLTPFWSCLSLQPPPSTSHKCRAWNKEEARIQLAHPLLSLQRKPGESQEWKAHEESHCGRVSGWGEHAEEEDERSVRPGLEIKQTWVWAKVQSPISCVALRKFLLNLFKLQLLIRKWG